VEDWQLMEAAVATEAEGHRALLAGDDAAARDHLRAASDLYRQSWEAAGPRAFGRLIGMLKAAVIAGDARDEAAYVRAAIEGHGDSPASSYAVAVAALVQGDLVDARGAAFDMGQGRTDAFRRTGDAIEYIATRDHDKYAAALNAIVDDFESREEHLTGVPIADTALMLERLAADRGMAVRRESELLPG
jgi:hypothetical protein